MTSVHTNIREAFFFFFLRGPKSLIGLQVRDELKRTSPLRPARKNMVDDPIRKSQGANNADICGKDLLLKIVTNVTKNSANKN